MNFELCQNPRHGEARLRERARDRASGSLLLSGLQSVDLRTVDDGTETEPETPGGKTAAAQRPTPMPPPVGSTEDRSTPAPPRQTPMVGTQAARTAAQGNPAPRSKFAMEQAEERLKSLLTWGIVLSLMGGFCMGIGLAADSFWGTFLAAVIAWVGTALLTVSLIGYGVKYGREAANV